MSRYEIQPWGHYFLLTRVTGAKKERASAGHTFHYAASPPHHPSLYCTPRTPHAHTHPSQPSCTLQSSLSYFEAAA